MSKTTSLTQSLLRIVRYLYRVPLLLVHLVLGLPLTLAIMSLPVLANRRVSPNNVHLDSWILCWWQRQFVRIFGLQVRTVGRPIAGPVLFVANHVSWVDISVMHSQANMGFVAKQEIANWPLIGRLALKGKTIFHRRGNAQSLDNVVVAMIERLQHGAPIGVFPEGHSRGGGKLGIFHARIFQAAVETSSPVQPVALQYGSGGCAQSLVAFRPKETFMHNLVRLLGEPSRQTSVYFLEPIDVREVTGRRQVAHLARERIFEAMQSKD